MKLNNKGFGIIEGIFILFILAVIGAVGWRVYTVYTTDEPDLSQQVETQPTSEESSEDSQEEADDTEGYLVVEEWGVKFKMTNPHKFSYVINNEEVTDDTVIGSSYQGELTPSFKAEFIESEDCEPGVVLYRVEELSEDNTMSFKKIGAYNYVIGGAPGTCSDEPTTNPDDVLKQEFLDEFTLDNLVAS